jgi:hypothetical protein
MENYLNSAWSVENLKVTKEYLVTDAELPGTVEYLPSTDSSIIIVLLGQITCFTILLVDESSLEIMFFCLIT